MSPAPNSVKLDLSLVLAGAGGIYEEEEEEKENSIAEDCRPIGMMH